MLTLTNPKLSIIVPIYNGEKYIARCLDSIIGQTMQATQIICVDDASSDKTNQILQDYAKADSRIEIISLSRNQKLGYCRNIGLNKATGLYVLFVDADDWLVDNLALENICSHTNDDIDILRFQIDTYRDNSNQLINNQASYQKVDYDNYFKISPLWYGLYTHQDEIARYVYNDSKTYFHGLVFKNSFIKEKGLKALPYNYFEDIITPFWLLQASSLKIVNQSYYAYYLNHSSMTHNNFNQRQIEDKFNDIFALLKDFKKTLDENGQLREHYPLYLQLIYDKIFYLYYKKNVLTGIAKSKFIIENIYNLFASLDLTKEDCHLFNYQYPYLRIFNYSEPFYSTMHLLKTDKNITFASKKTFVLKNFMFKTFSAKIKHYLIPQIFIKLYTKKS